ncbi:MAG: hypothetical protein D8M59_15990 [Planctomycetes bacterium]|nr:hypothetical protein [Planctomycetota bacterium]NOG52759.1 hypothetical protein [Planctomycetota bacterium]
MKRLPACITALLLTVAAPLHAQTGTLEFYNDFDPNRPTVIAVHGWFGSIDYPNYFGRSPSYLDRANLIGWEWDAFFFIGPIEKARESGRLLAGEVHGLITADYPDYDQPIQLAGHSLGTHVVTEATLTLRDLGRDDPLGLAYQVNQLTLVDGGPSPELLQMRLDDLAYDQLEDLKIDNYFSPGRDDGVGIPYFNVTNVQMPLSHGDMWSWYFISLDEPPPGPYPPGAQYSIVGDLAGFDAGELLGWMIAGRSTPLDPTDDYFRFLR